MILVAIIALILTYAARINRTPRDPYAAALYRMSEWCSSSVDAFEAEGHYDWAAAKPDWIVDKRATPSMACLLRLAYVQPPRRNSVMGGCNIAHLALAVDGRSQRTADIFNWAIQGGQSTIPPAEMASIRALVAKLPSSQSRIPNGNSLLVGFSRKGVWETRTYDTARLPPETLEVIAKTWPTIPWLPAAPASGTAAAGSPSGQVDAVATPSSVSGEL